MRSIYFSLLIACVGFPACGKKDWTRRTSPEDVTLTGKAFIKFHNLTVGSPISRLTVDGNSTGNTNLAFGAIFPATTMNYCAIEAGARTLNFKDTSRNLQLNIEMAATFEEGKHYSVFTYDTLQTARHLIIPDEIVKPDDKTSRLRFINMAFSSAPVPNLDIYSKVSNTTVFNNIANLEKTDYINYFSRIADTFYVRETGTTANLGEVIFTPGASRSHTILFYGRYQQTTGASARKLVMVTNY